MRRIRNTTLTLAVIAGVASAERSSAQAQVGAGWVGNGQTDNAAAVWCVQDILNSVGYNAAAEDGLWGLTARAAWVFQSTYRDILVTPDGIVGPRNGDTLPDVLAGYCDSGWDRYCSQWLPTSRSY